jgi:hypothetical protein
LGSNKGAVKGSPDRSAEQPVRRAKIERILITYTGANSLIPICILIGVLAPSAAWAPPWMYFEQGVSGVSVSEGRNPPVRVSNTIHTSGWNTHPVLKGRNPSPSPYPF